MNKLLLLIIKYFDIIKLEASIPTFPVRILSTLPTCSHIFDEHGSMPIPLLESMPLYLWKDLGDYAT